MVQLAKRHHGGTMTRLDDLAQTEEISANFLVQIFNDLRRSGIVDSRRGKNGGYLLSRPADSITLYQIIEAVEPSLLGCYVSTDGTTGAALHSAWGRVFDQFEQQLHHINLANIAAGEEAPMFHI